MLKDKVHAIPREGQSTGCFEWYEAETGGTFASDSFDGTREWIIAHRKANPRFSKPTDGATVEAEMMARYDARLRSQYGERAKQWLMGPASPPTPPAFSWPALRSRPGLAAVGSGSSKIKSGVATLIAWIGSGLKPVDQATANARATICATCEKNVQLEGIQKAIGTMGDILHSIMQAKSELKLTTPHDAQLHQCSACLCVCSTKVWTPTDHIKKGMTPEVQAALAAKCWIRPLL